MSDLRSGYREVEHTADWELEVWAPDLLTLLESAAHGMYALAGVELEDGVHVERRISLPAEDPEQLLVAYLSELLWFGEQEKLGFDDFELQMSDNQLIARLKGAPIIAQSKEIKAVTFHNLAIRQVAAGLTANIVFDV